MSRRAWILILVVVGALIALPIAWYLISPVFIDVVVNEELPMSMATATAAMSEAMAEPDKVMDEPMPDEEMASMVILTMGEFYDLGGHPGQGTATVYQLEDGSRVLRFEQFEVINGPQLHVWLVPQDPVPDTVGRELEGYFDLGPLKGNIGDQNYEIPTDLVLDEYASVVIWCVPFRVPFNAAPLTAP